jgi:sRNA-binding protein
MTSALIRETRKTLLAKYPQCFCNKGSLKKPLKIGIKFDLFKAEPTIPQDLIRKALVDYCNGVTYLVALLKVGTPRVDLRGNQDGSVSEYHAEKAAEKLLICPADLRQRWCDAAGVKVPEKKNPAEVGHLGEAGKQTLEGSNA